MDSNNRPDIGMVLFTLGALLLIALLVILCASNPGGGAVLTMAVYTRSPRTVRAKLVRRQRRPGCCLALVLLVLVAWFIALTLLYI